MADIKELEKINAGLVAENEAMAGIIEDLTAKNNELIAKLAKAGTGKPVAVPIPGIIKVSLETREGKKVTGEYKFRDGVRKVPMDDGLLVSSEALMRIANGEKATDEELKAFPRLRSVSKEIAVARIEYFISIGSTILQPVKK